MCNCAFHLWDWAQWFPLIGYSATEHSPGNYGEPFATGTTETMMAKNGHWELTMHCIMVATDKVWAVHKGKGNKQTWARVCVAQHINFWSWEYMSPTFKTFYTFTFKVSPCWKRQTACSIFQLAGFFCLASPCLCNVASSCGYAPEAPTISAGLCS